MSTFSLDEDQRQIQDAMHRFAVDEIRPRARDCDEEAGIPPEFLARTWELGISTSLIPECYGGYESGRSVLNNAIMAEELAYGDLALGMAAQAPNLCVLPLLEMGCETLQQEHLPAFCGETYVPGSLALMEYRAGFDVNDLRTSARREGDHWCLNGTKCLVPLAEDAQAFIVVAATVPGGGPQGTAAFVVKKKTRGLKIEGRERNMGLNALPTYRLRLQNCEVPLQNRLAGFDANRLVACCRIGLAASAVGLAAAVKDYSVAYSKEREAFGQPIATRQTIAFMLAEMAIEIDSCRMLTWKAAWTADQGENPLRLACLAKGYAAEQAFKIADYGVSILGGHGLIREHPIELWFRDARAFAMLEGLIMA